jgi:hypothetical protein
MPAACFEIAAAGGRVSSALTSYIGAVDGTIYCLGIKMVMTYALFTAR